MAWREREGYGENEDWWNQPDVSPVSPMEPTVSEEPYPGAAWYVLEPPYPAPAGQQWRRNITTGVWELEPATPGTNGVPANPPPGGDPGTPPPPPPPGPMGDFGDRPAPSFGGGNWPSYAAPGFSDPGMFDPGPAFAYPNFQRPTAESMSSEPGFQFRMDQGRKALEASAAGRGVLRSGGTLKDILNYGQNFASQEYGNVYDRALREYDTNRRNKFDEWQTGYQGRKDRFGFGADRSNAMNLFNQGNSQFDFNARQRQMEVDRKEAMDKWMKEGDWLRDLGVAGLD